MNAKNNQFINEKSDEYIIIPQEREKKTSPIKLTDYYIYFLIGLILCFLNMKLNKYLNENYLFMIQIFSYLIIIGFALVFGIIFGILKRIRGYSYLCGFMVGGLIYAILEDLYIGLYTFFVSFMLFLIPYLIFKLWRKISKIIIK